MNGTTADEKEYDEHDSSARTFGGGPNYEAVSRKDRAHAPRIRKVVVALALAIILLWRYCKKASAATIILRQELFQVQFATYIAEMRI